MKHFLILILISSTLLYSNLSLARITKQSYCADTRNSESTEQWIKMGIELKENYDKYVVSRPSKKKLREYHDHLIEKLQQHVDEDLETAMKNDEEINSQYRNNNFPQFAVDRVHIREWIVYQILIKEERSITQHKMSVYYHCMDIIKPLN